MAAWDAGQSTKGRGRTWAARWVRLVACALWLVGSGSAATAWAHPDVEEGLRLAADLEFEAALAAFDRALASGELTRDEVVQALTEKALLQHAVRDREGLVDTFTWLAAIEPDHVLGVRAPPDLVAQWTSVRDQTRGRLAVKVDHSEMPGKLHAAAALSGVRPNGVETELALRLQGGEWEHVEGGVVDRSFPDGAEVDLYARVLGLGGLELAHDGTAEQPVHVHVPSEGADRASFLVASSSEEESQQRRRRWWIASGAAVVVAAAVLTGALLATRGQPAASTDLTPSVTW